jgi:cysteine desulfurase
MIDFIKDIFSDNDDKKKEKQLIKKNKSTSLKLYKVNYGTLSNDNNQKAYYFDNNATTLIYDSYILKNIMKWLSCGNPSNNLHFKGVEAHNQIDKCRKIIANDLDIEPSELLFTGSATEANNIIIQGIVNKEIKKMKTDEYGGYRTRMSIITTEFEHPSVLNVFKQFENNDYVDVIYVPVELDINNQYYGCINPKTFEYYLSTAVNPILVSIMYANNETGAINDIRKLASITKKIDKNIFFHSDVTQAIGKFIIHPKELNIDSVTFSGHKFHGPKGIGCLYMKNTNNTCPLKCGICYGGEQEESIRPGTENVANITGLALALKAVHEDRKEKNKALKDKKMYLLIALKNIGCQFILPKYSLCNTIMVVLPHLSICNRNVCKILSEKFNICIGISSACQTGTISHVLKAMNIDEEDKYRILRISMCDYNTIKECEYLIGALYAVINQFYVQ